MVERTGLFENFKECLHGGLSEESLKRYRNAVELFYKAVVSLCDILILETMGDVPNFHKQRDQLLSKINGTVNNIRVGLHTLYRQSYYKTDFSQDDCKQIKNAIKQIVVLKRPGKDIEEIVKKI